MKVERLGLIGYGEVGRTFSIGLKDKPGVVASGAWDLKFAARNASWGIRPLRDSPTCRRTRPGRSTRTG